ncbi:hypothetical protein DSUL_80029 [Desulfovibrionales bacterium]
MLGTNGYYLLGSACKGLGLALSQAADNAWFNSYGILSIIRSTKKEIRSMRQYYFRSASYVGFTAEHDRCYYLKS